MVGQDLSWCRICICPTVILQGCPEGASCGITPLKEQIGYYAFEPGGCPVGASEKEPSQCITGGH